MNHQFTIMKELKELANYEKAQGNAFKSRAYNKVYQAISNIPIYSMDDLKDVPGVGEKIRVKIQEIIETGHLHQADAIRRQNNTLNPLVELQKVYGIGPKKAKDLMAIGITSIPVLRAYVQQHPDKQILHEKQKVGLKYVEDLQLRIPRSEMIEHEKILKKAIASICEGVIVGSYRRNRPDSGDIDMLIRSDDPSHLDAVLNKLKSVGYVQEDLALGNKKFMGVCHLDTHHPMRRLDILLTPPSEYPYAILYFTGSDKFNIDMRKHALTLGYSLNEHGLTPAPTAPINTEEDIFTFLKYPYLPPSERENSVIHVK